MEVLCANYRDVFVLNPVHLKCFLCVCMYKNDVGGRFSHAACQWRSAGLNDCAADITVYLFFIANICLACYSVITICISSTDFLHKCETLKVTTVVWRKKRGFH